MAATYGRRDVDAFGLHGTSFPGVIARVGSGSVSGFGLRAAGFGLHRSVTGIGSIVVHPEDVAAVATPGRCAPGSRPGTARRGSPRCSRAARSGTTIARSPATSSRAPRSMSTRARSRRSRRRARWSPASRARRVTALYSGTLRGDGAVVVDATTGDARAIATGTFDRDRRAITGGVVIANVRDASAITNGAIAGHLGLGATFAGTRETFAIAGALDATGVRVRSVAAASLRAGPRDPPRRRHRLRDDRHDRWPTRAPAPARSRRDAPHHARAARPPDRTHRRSGALRSPTRVTAAPRWPRSRPPRTRSPTGASPSRSTPIRRRPQPRRGRRGSIAPRRSITAPKTRPLAFSLAATIAPTRIELGPTTSASPASTGRVPAAPSPSAEIVVSSVATARRAAASALAAVVDRRARTLAATLAARLTDRRDRRAARRSRRARDDAAAHARAPRHRVERRARRARRRHARDRDHARRDPRLAARGETAQLHGQLSRSARRPRGAPSRCSVASSSPARCTARSRSPARSSRPRSRSTSPPSTSPSTSTRPSSRSSPHLEVTAHVLARRPGRSAEARRHHRRRRHVLDLTADRRSGAPGRHHDLARRAALRLRAAARARARSPRRHRRPHRRGPPPRRPRRARAPDRQAPHRRTAACRSRGQVGTLREADVDGRRSPRRTSTIHATGKLGPGTVATSQSGCRAARERAHQGARGDQLR